MDIECAGTCRGADDIFKRALHGSHCRLWRKLLAKKAARGDKREGAAEQDGEKERAGEMQ